MVLKGFGLFLLVSNFIYLYSTVVKIVVNVFNRLLKTLINTAIIVISGSAPRSPAVSIHRILSEIYEGRNP